MRDGSDGSPAGTGAAGRRANRERWVRALREVAETHRNAAQAARFAGDEDGATRHLRVAERAEQVVVDLGLLAGPAARGSDAGEVAPA